MKLDTNRMMTNGKMARTLGVDPKTLRKWARRGLVPSYINQYNGYRYYFKNEVMRVIRSHPGSTTRSIDEKRKRT